VNEVALPIYFIYLKRLEQIFTHLVLELGILVTGKAKEVMTRYEFFSKNSFSSLLIS
jgi:hypothetical protein